MTARVSMLLKSRASPDMLPFSPCNKKWLAIWHMKRPLFPTTLSIRSYDIGKWVGLRAYQHPLVKKWLFIGLHLKILSWLRISSALPAPVRVTFATICWNFICKWLTVKIPSQPCVTWISHESGYKFYCILLCATPCCSFFLTAQLTMPLFKIYHKHFPTATNIYYYIQNLRLLMFQKSN